MKHFIWIAALLLAACQTEERGTEPQELQAKTLQEREAEVQEETIKITTTLFALEDAIKAVGGEHVSVTNIIPPDVDAHTYEPSMRALLDIHESDAFIYSGGGMEGFIADAVNILDEEEVLLVEASEDVTFLAEGEHSHSHSHSHDHNDGDSHDHDHSHEDDHAHEYNPHVFIDPNRMQIMVDTIAGSLASLAPEEAAAFDANAEEYKTALAEVDDAFREASEDFAGIPIFVAHAGYDYWEEVYGLEQYPLTGFSPEEEPSMQQMEESLAAIEEAGAQYLFVENTYTIPAANTILEDAGMEERVLHNMETVTEEQQQAGVDYPTLMYENIDAIREALEQQDEAMNSSGS